MSSHSEIKREAAEVVAGVRTPRNPVKEHAPWITEQMLVGVSDVDGKVAGYEFGGAHKGTFYREFEGITAYPDEPFIRVVIYGDETYDIETRIPLSMVRAVVAVEPGNPANQAPAVVPSDEQIDAAWFKLPVARTAGGLTDLFAHRIQFARAVLALLSPPGVLVEPAGEPVAYQWQHFIGNPQVTESFWTDWELCTKEQYEWALATPDHQARELYTRLPEPAPAVPVGGIKEPEQQGHLTALRGKFPVSAGEGSGKGGA